MITVVLAALAAASTLAVASAQPVPHPKVGQCPAGYRESAGYCAPTSDRAPTAVPKTGSLSKRMGAVRGLLPRRAPAALTPCLGT
jgi:hypothetical protein